jgi:hypothetical protein
LSEDVPLARLSASVRSEVVLAAMASTNGRPLAVGWATVELDRAVTELGAALGVPADRFADAAASISLGARCLVADGVLPDGVSLALLEPNTEGRLAATLARHDEGPAAVWLAVERLAKAVASLRTTARPGTTERALAGPYGAELLLDGPLHGPHLFLVERPGTIRA